MQTGGTAQVVEFNIKMRIKEFSIGLAKYFLKYAGYAYCETRQQQDNICCPDVKNEWELIAAEDFEDEKYNFAILKSETYQKVILGFPGTRTKIQLMNEMFNSGPQIYEGDQKVVSFFYDLHKKIKPKVYEHLKPLFEKYPTYQYIYVGHSLGGAEAALFAYDSVLSETIKKTEDSPILITYGMPRVGNDVFANNFMTKVTQIYRIVRQGDLVVSIPICDLATLSTKCETVLDNNKFDSNLKLNRQKSNVTKNNFYLWHFGGMYLFDNAMKEYNKCPGVGENPGDSKCKVSHNMDTEIHKIYFDKKISQICTGDKKNKK